MAFVQHYINRVTSHGQPQALFNLRTKDPLLRLVNRLGFETELYTPRRTPWEDIPCVGISHALDDIVSQHLVVLSTWLATIVFFLWINRSSSGIVRQFAGMAALGGVVGFTPVYGKTGLGLVDFGVPALGFLAALHLVDIFFLRGPEDTKDWSFCASASAKTALTRSPHVCGGAIASALVPD